MSELDDKVRDAARVPVLLVATDFDGTVAPIVTEPAAAEADREALVALRMLSQLPQTYVAVVSGRALADLAPRLLEAGDVHLIGSHGSEFAAGFVDTLSVEARTALDALDRELSAIASRFAGALVERKPASLAFHYRNVAEAEQQAALAAVLAGPGRREAVHLRHGKKVVEVSVLRGDKGLALERLRHRIGASAVVFVGDDATDEDAFATLAGPDLGVKVGDGATAARHRVGGTLEVARLLARIAEERSSWLAGSVPEPIEGHSLLSDQRTVALVAPSGRITWLCLPRIDSSAVFAELVGGPTAGFFEVRAANAKGAPVQRWRGDSFVLETEWPGVRVVDYLDASGGRAYQRAGRTDLVRAIEGTGEAVVTFAPRLDFGRVHTRLARAQDGLVVEGGLDSIVLRAPGIAFELIEDGPHQTARGVIAARGEPIVLELRYGTANLEATGVPERARREANVRFWQNWAAALSNPQMATPCAAPVKRSALVLKALTYGPSGAMAAAATTSLPESLGGVRNWDYRFCWPRDAALAAHALALLGATGAGLKLLDWLVSTLEDSEPGSLIAPVYTVSGGHLHPEADLPHLSGYAGSRPVRLGNVAAHQVQLDVFGAIADLVAELARRGAALTPEHFALLESMVAAVERHWTEADHGIWELRLPRRHHVHSKVMCWLTVERALRVSQYLGRSRPGWTALRDRIGAEVLGKGAPDGGAFGSAFEDASADASALWVGLSGLLTPSDPRFARTLDQVERLLRVGPTVYRYRFDDGLPGFEGGFNLCTTWLIEAYQLVGRRDDAARLFDDYCALAGPTGLIAEQFDPRSRRALGNHPQAYSHAGLIRAGVRLAERPG